MTPRELARQPFSRLFVGMLAAYFAVVLATPELWLWLAAKEGPFEHLGHMALVVAVALWVGVALRAARRPRALAIGVALYLGLALLEEIDWGAVYGVDLGHSLVARLTGGSPNFHNAQKSHASLAGWSVAWMSAPMLLFFGLPLTPLSKLWRGLAPAASLAVEGASFLAAALLTVLVDGLPLLERRLGYVPRAGAGDPIGAPLGFFQIAFYVAWALVAWRALRQLRGAEPASGVG